MDITAHLEEALKESKKSKALYQMGAVLVKGNKVVSSGYNRTSGKVGYLSRRYNIEIWSLHAEQDCLLKTNEADGSTLFVSGRKSNGNRINCKPCLSCMKIIKKRKIKEVIFETKTGIKKIGVN